MITGLVAAFCYTCFVMLGMTMGYVVVMGVHKHA